MCTAAVCPVSPPQHYVGFDDKDGSLTEEALAHYGRKWRTTNTSERLANFMLNLSPIRDRRDTIYRSPMVNIPFQISPKRDKIARLDIICNLPIEISLNIFARLNEQDLCRLVLIITTTIFVCHDKNTAKILYIMHAIENNGTPLARCTVNPYLMQVPVYICDATWTSTIVKVC